MSKQVHKILIMKSAHVESECIVVRVVWNKPLECLFISFLHYYSTTYSNECVLWTRNRTDCA